MNKLFLLLCTLAFTTAGFAAVPVAANTLQLKRHPLATTSTPDAQNYQNLHALNQVADYTKAELRALEGQVTEQVYQVNGNYYRNNNYHKKTDTLATLNTARMAQVVDSVYQAVQAFSN